MQPPLVDPPLIEEIVREMARGAGISLFYQFANRRPTAEDERQIRETLRQVPELHGPVEVRGRIASAEPFRELDVTLIMWFLTQRDLDPLLFVIYQHAVRKLLESKGYKDDHPIYYQLIAHVPRGGPADWRRAYEHALDLAPSGTLRLPVQLALFELGDALYTPGNTLLPRLREFNIDWRSILLDVASENPDYQDPVQIAAFARERLERIVVERQQQQLGPESQTARETTDDFDRRRGLLTANCDQWTYRELEFWVLHAAQSADLNILRQWFVESQNEQGFDVQIEGDLDRKSLLEVVEPFLGKAAKRYLCSLLLQTGTTPPAVWGRESFKWYDTRLLVSYLDSDVVAQLVAEVQTELMSSTEPAASNTNDLAHQIARDVVRQLDAEGRPLRLDILDVHLQAGATPEEEVPEGHLVAVVGLSGQLLLSPLDLGGVETPLPAFRVLVEPGDLFVVDGFAFTDAAYDHLVLRTHEGDARAVVLRLEGY